MRCAARRGASALGMDMRRTRAEGPRAGLVTALLPAAPPVPATSPVKLERRSFPTCRP